MIKQIALLISISIITFTSAQNPVEYMENLNIYNQDLMQNSWKYMSAIARDASPKRVENLRSKTEQLIRSSLKNINSMGAYKGDDSYRQATLKYQNHSLDLMTGKAQKLVDMEAISKQSYDGLEAYILYQREINKINDREAAILNQSQKKFASSHDVNLIEEESELAQKIEKGSQVLNYKQDLFLVFARCSMYELDMLSRINTTEAYDFKQAGITLLELVDKSRAALDTIKDINSDLSLRRATSKALDFYEEEAETLIPVVSEFRKSNNEFAAFQKEFEKTPKKKRTQEMVNEYNEKAQAMNQTGEKFNNLLQTYNQKREKVYNDFNQTSADYVQKHMPAE